MILAIMLITAALTVISLITLSNMLFFPRLRPANTPGEQYPFVSVMIPARNEAANIGQTVSSLLAQSGIDFEVIVLDDQSDDGTADEAHAAASSTSNRLTVVRGQPLPEGWLGKNWACHQMAQIACGDILIFTDADVRWAPDALLALVDAVHHSHADLYTVWPTQKTETWSERLVVPLMAVVVLGYLPVIGTHYVPLGVFGAANGQCMAWRRSAYDALHGHEVVRDNVLEDVTLARMLKSRNGRLRMADGSDLISCRMYSDWPSVRDGYAKNILAGYGGSVTGLLLAAIFHWAIFLFPWVWLALGWATLALPQWPWWPLALIVMGLTVRALTAAFTRQRVRDSLLMPVSVLMMTRITVQSIWWHYRHGGPLWKGRIIRRHPVTEEIHHG